MNESQEIARRYIEVWNETDGTRRRALVEELYTQDACYVDPLVRAAGWAEIDASIAGAQRQFPGFTFSIAGSADGHHETARFTWHLAQPGASEPLVIGSDVAVLEDGRISRVYGFLDKVPVA